MKAKAAIFNGPREPIEIKEYELPEVEESIRAWKTFKATSKKLAEFNLIETLQEKKR